MSSDSTELTFIRCPACRSLVPAMSSVCRMCGSSLAASNEDVGEPENGDTDASRVRQRTVHTQTADMHEAVKKLRAEYGGEGEAAHQPADDGDDGRLASDLESQGGAEPGAASKSAKDDASFSVSNFEEVSSLDVDESSSSDTFDSTQTVPLGAAERYSQEVATGEDELELDIVDPLSAFVEEVDEDAVDTVAQEALSQRDSVEKHSEPKRGSLRESKDDFIVRDSTRAEPKSDEVPEKKSKEVHPTTPPTERSSAQESSSRAMVQSGASRRGGKLSFRSKGQAPHKKRERENRDASSEAKATTSGSEKRERGSTTSRVSNELGRQDRRAEAQSTVGAKKHMDGRLVGWFVSYADSSGVAFELREGRFFVTQQSLKPSDFILEDESISTPHALVKIDPEVGCVVQDLMSERGVFVRSRGSDNYTRLVEESATLQHGDWVRFGDVEFNISLVAHVGVS